MEQFRHLRVCMVGFHVYRKFIEKNILQADIYKDFVNYPKLL